MILADKILTLRKKNGWSQEELAEKLNVTRQSISKWEGAIAIPDINRIIDMAKLFGVTTDYLLRDDLDEAVYSNDDDKQIRKISLKEANEYLDNTKVYAKQLALGTLLCVLSPTILILLSGISEVKKTISEAVSASIGLVSLFALIALAIAIFIISSIKMKKYENLQKEDFELEYGVSSIIKEKKDKYYPKHTITITIAIICIILGVLPLILSGIFEAQEFIVICMVDLLITVVGFSTFAIIIVSTIKSSYDCLLCEEDYSRKSKQESTINERFAGFYWPIVTAGYLCWSFISEKWDLTWIVWPIAGLIFAGIQALLHNKTND